MSAKHTPGPWCISEAGNSFEIIQDCWGDDGDHLGEVVVRAPEIDPENGGIRNKADAILIAASPTMYEYINQRANEGDAHAAKIIASI